MKWVIILICLIATYQSSSRLALAGSGFYLSGELGANFAVGPDLDESDNDRASACDEYINPMYANNPLCTDPAGRGDSWMSKFDSAEGILAGAAAGYSLRKTFPDRLLGRFRIESEYFYRDSEYDQTTDIISGDGGGGSIADKLGGEIARAENRIGSITSHSLFANLYVDLFNDSHFTPYVGLGIGVGFTDVDYGSLWARNLRVRDDEGNLLIRTGQGWDNAEQIRQNLAGTTTSEQTVLTDNLFGHQLLFGVDYALTQSVSFGVKGRWVRFETFRDSGSWDRLRSHDSNLRLDGSEPVVYQVETKDIEFFGLSVNLKYHI